MRETVMKTGEWVGLAAETRESAGVGVGVARVKEKDSCFFQLEGGDLKMKSQVRRSKVK